MAAAAPLVDCPDRRASKASATTNADRLPAGRSDLILARPLGRRAWSMARMSVWGKSHACSRLSGSPADRRRRRPEPELRQGTVKIAVDWCGICGTGLHEYILGANLGAHARAAHRITGASMPVLGHEFAGRVVEVGEGVTRAKVGDSVTVEPIINCGQCPECRRGDITCAASSASSG